MYPNGVPYQTEETRRYYQSLQANRQAQSNNHNLSSYSPFPPGSSQPNFNAQYSIPPYQSQPGVNNYYQPQPDPARNIFAHSGSNASYQPQSNPPQTIFNLPGPNTYHQPQSNPPQTIFNLPGPNTYHQPQFNPPQTIFNQPVPTQQVFNQPFRASPSTFARQDDPFLISRAPPREPRWNGETEHPNKYREWDDTPKFGNNFPLPNVNKDSRTTWAESSLSRFAASAAASDKKHWVCPNRQTCTKIYRRRHIMCSACPFSRKKAPRKKCVR
jgi:hypothetical protein